MTQQKLSKLKTSELEALAYNDPDDPTSPPASVIKAAALELERRDSLKFKMPAFQTRTPERVHGIAI